MIYLHYVKSGRIRGYSGPYFPAVELNTDQNNSEYGQFSRSAQVKENECQRNFLFTKKREWLWKFLSNVYLKCINREETVL